MSTLNAEALRERIKNGPDNLKAAYIQLLKTTGEPFVVGDPNSFTGVLSNGKTVTAQTQDLAELHRLQAEASEPEVVTSTEDLSCPTCQKLCANKAGLGAHLRACKV